MGRNMVVDDVDDDDYVDDDGDVDDDGSQRGLSSYFPAASVEPPMRGENGNICIRRACILIASGGLDLTLRLTQLYPG